MARVILLLLIIIIVQQNVVHCIPFGGSEYKRAASDELLGENNLLDDTNGNLDDSDISNKHKTKNKIQNSDPLHAGLDEQNINDINSGQVVDTKGDSRFDDQSAKNFPGESQLDEPNEDDSKNLHGSKPDVSPATENENRNVFDIKIKSSKPEHDGESLGTADKSKKDLNQPGNAVTPIDDDKVSALMVTTSKMSNVLVNSISSVSDNNRLDKPVTSKTLPQTISTLKSTTQLENFESAFKKNGDTNKGLDKSVTDKIVLPTDSTSKSTTEIGSVESTSEENGQSNVALDKPVTDKIGQPTVSTLKTTTKLGDTESDSNENVESDEGLDKPITDKTIPSTTLTSTTELKDVENNSKENVEPDKINAGKEPISDDEKIIVLTTRSTTDGSTRYSPQENTLPATQQQRIPQSTLNQILTQSARRPMSSYYSQTTGTSRFPTTSRVYTSRVNAPLYTPTTVQHAQNLPTQESTYLSSVSDANDITDIRTTMPVQVYNTVEPDLTSSKKPLEISVTEQGNISNTASMAIETGKPLDLTTVGNRNEISESTLDMQDTTATSMTSEETTTMSESPTTDQKLIVAPTSTATDTTAQANMTKSIPVYINPAIVATTSSSTIETTKSPKEIKTKGGHNRKRPPVVITEGREHEIVVSNGDQEETMKSTSHVTPTTEKTALQNKTKENTGKGLLQKVQDTVKKYGAIKVSLALLTVVTILLVSIFLCCKLCRKKGYKMRQRRLREYGQEKEFLLRERKKNDRYSNDALTLLDGSSEDEF